MKIITGLHPSVLSKLYRVWLDIQFASINALQETIIYCPTGLVLDDTSWAELEQLLGILRKAGGITILDKVTDGKKYDLTIGYAIKVIEPTFSDLESLFPNYDLTNHNESEIKNQLVIIPNDKMHKVLGKMHNLLASKEKIDNFLLAKCIDSKLTRKAYGNGKSYKRLIKSRFKTLNKYLKKKSLFVTIEGEYSKIVSHPII